MRYYCYNHYDESHPDKGYVRTLSEDEIIAEYYDEWYDMMLKKLNGSKGYLDANYSRLDCIDEWCIVHWAWESTNE